jgi:hypothetical protein
MYQRKMAQLREQKEDLAQKKVDPSRGSGGSRRMKSHID